MYVLVAGWLVYFALVGGFLLLVKITKSPQAAVIAVLCIITALLQLLR